MKSEPNPAPNPPDDAALEVASTIITSNIAYAQWPRIFAGDATLTLALLERLLHHAATVVIEGESYRGPRPKERRAGIHRSAAAGENARPYSGGPPLSNRQDLSVFTPRLAAPNGVLRG